MSLSWIKERWKAIVPTIGNALATLAVWGISQYVELPPAIQEHLVVVVGALLTATTYVGAYQAPRNKYDD